MRGTRMWILALGVLVILAGCLEAGEDLEPATATPETRPPDVTEDPRPNETADSATSREAQPVNRSSLEANASSLSEPEEPDPPPAHPLAYGGPSGGTEHVVPIEGAFGPNETCLPVGCLLAGLGQGEDFHHEIELSPHIPAGIPVRLTGEIRYDQNGTGDIHPNMRTGEAQIYGARITNTQGPTRIDFRLSSPADDAVVLELGGHAPDGAQGTAYSGMIEISADPSVVPSGVPTGVPVPQGAKAIELTPVHGDRARFTVWSPEGERVTRTTVDEAPARIDVANRSSGTYAVQIEVPASGARIAVVADDRPSDSLRPLDTVAVLGPARQARPSQPVAGTFEVSIPPVSVGVYEQGAQQVKVRTGEDPALEVSSPAGVVMDRGAGQPATFDTAKVGGSLEDRFATAGGTRDLVPGTYEFQVSDHRDAGVAFGGYALVYAGATEDP